MQRYVIKREDISGLMLAKVEYGKEDGQNISKTLWTYDLKEAIVTDDADEANRIITCIGDIIDWKLEQQCYFEEIKI